MYTEAAATPTLAARPSGRFINSAARATCHANQAVLISSRLSHSSAFQSPHRTFCRQCQLNNSCNCPSSTGYSFLSATFDKTKKHPLKLTDQPSC